MDDEIASIHWYITTYMFSTVGVFIIIISYLSGCEERFYDFFL